MHYNLGAGRRKWCDVIIESSVELCFGGNAWIDSGWSEEVECDGSKGGESAPQAH